MLQDFLTQNIFAFILIFVRLGAAITIMPGVGDSLTPQNIRLYIALGLSLALTPVLAPHMPDPVPGTAALFVLIIAEFIIGLFIGTVARILMAALDTAGMIISLASGLGSAQLFNPGFATQGSLIGAFLSITGVTLMLVTNMHHLLFYGLAGSYDIFPVGGLPEPGAMADVIASTLASSFMIGFQIAAPFVVISMVVYVGMGVLTRLMPQIQVFLIAIPVQILLSLVLMTLVISSMLMFWLGRFEAGMIQFIGAAQGGG